MTAPPPPPVATVPGTTADALEEELHDEAQRLIADPSPYYSGLGLALLNLIDARREAEAQLAAAEARATAAERERDEAVGLLRAAEWSDGYVNSEGDDAAECPWCGSISGDGHADDCDLGAFLARLSTPGDAPTRGRTVTFTVDLPPDVDPARVTIRPNAGPTGEPK